MCLIGASCFPPIRVYIDGKKNLEGLVDIFVASMLL